MFLADRYTSSILNRESVPGFLSFLVSSYPGEHTKIGHRLEQLRWQRESDICDICDTDKSIENRLISLCSPSAILARSCLL